nr:hypothetical protein [Tanacetum cinerariifolium]
MFVHEEPGLKRLKVERKKGNYSKSEEMECYFKKYLHLVSLRHHQADEKKIRNGRRRTRSKMTTLFNTSVFTDFSLLDKSERMHGSINNVILTIVEIGVSLYDLSKQASQKHTIRARFEVTSTRSPLMTQLDSDAKALKDHSVVKTL